MQIQIAGTLFISADRETRFAGECNLPSAWLDLQKQASGDIHILTHTPIVVVFSDGTEEFLSWYNPQAASPRLHPQDLLEVMVFHEKINDKFADLLKVIRFCEYSLRKTRATGNKDLRAGILRDLNDDHQLRELVGKYILRTKEKSVLKPRSLRALLEYEITPRTLQMELKEDRKHTSNPMSEDPDSETDSANTNNQPEEMETDHVFSVQHLSSESQAVADEYDRGKAILESTVEVKDIEPALDAPEKPTLPSNALNEELIHIAAAVYKRICSLQPGLPPFEEALLDLRTRQKQGNNKLCEHFIQRLHAHENDNENQMAETALKVAKFLNA